MFGGGAQCKTCIDECVAGDSRCNPSDPNTLEECGDIDGDGCTEWGANPVTCLYGCEDLFPSGAQCKFFRGFNITVTTDKPTHYPNKPAELTITVTDLEGNPMEGVGLGIDDPCTQTCISPGATDISGQVIYNTTACTEPLFITAGKDGSYGTKLFIFPLDADLKLTVSTDKSSYKIGETASLTIWTNCDTDIFGEIIPGAAISVSDSCSDVESFIGTTDENGMIEYSTVVGNTSCSVIFSASKEGYNPTTYEKNLVGGINIELTATDTGGGVYGAGDTITIDFYVDDINGNPIEGAKIRESLSYFRPSVSDVGSLEEIATTDNNGHATYSFNIYHPFSQVVYFTADKDGYGVDIKEVYITVKPYDYIPITQGENYIGISVQPEDNAVGSVLGGLSINYAAKWNPSIQNWDFYPKREGYGTFSSINVGDGIIVHSNENSSIELFNDLQRPTIALEPGWNLFSLPIVVDDDVIPIAALTFEWNSNLLTYSEALNQNLIKPEIRELGTENQVTEIEKGKAYWMFSYVSLDLDTFKTSEQPIIIADSSDISYANEIAVALGLDDTAGSAIYSDDEVTSAQVEGRNVILVGDIFENSITAYYNDRFPIRTVWDGEWAYQFENGDTYYCDYLGVLEREVIDGRKIIRVSGLDIYGKDAALQRLKDLGVRNFVDGITTYNDLVGGSCADQPHVETFVYSSWQDDYWKEEFFGFVPVDFVNNYEIYVALKNTGEETAYDTSNNYVWSEVWFAPWVAEERDRGDFDYCNVLKYTKPDGTPYSVLHLKKNSFKPGEVAVAGPFIVEVNGYPWYDCNNLDNKVDQKPAVYSVAYMKDIDDGSITPPYSNCTDLQKLQGPDIWDYVVGEFLYCPVGPEKFAGPIIKKLGIVGRLAKIPLKEGTNSVYNIIKKKLPSIGDDVLANPQVYGLGVDASGEIVEQDARFLFRKIESGLTEDQIKLLSRMKQGGSLSDNYMSKIRMGKYPKSYIRNKVKGELGEEGGVNYLKQIEGYADDQILRNPYETLPKTKRPDIIVKDNLNKIMEVGEAKNHAAEITPSKLMTKKGKPGELGEQLLGHVKTVQSQGDEVAEELTLRVHVPGGKTPTSKPVEMEKAITKLQQKIQEETGQKVNIVFSEMYEENGQKLTHEFSEQTASELINMFPELR